MSDGGDITELLDAWQAWDARPKAEDAVRRFQSAVAVTADCLGTESTHIRRTLSQARIAGKSHVEAVALLRDQD